MGQQLGDWQGIPIDRVVAVVASLASGLEQVGSGYLVSGRLVLTAEHCTRDKKTGQPPRALRVVRASDGLLAGATVRAASAAVDLAVLELREAPWPHYLPAPRYGRVDRRHSGELIGCEAIGYPPWQLDPVDLHRGTAELNGTIRKTEDADSGYLVLRDQRLDSVAAASANGPWAGLSGALVFHAGAALGVVVQHHRRQGASAVRLVPFDRIAASQDEQKHAVAAALGAGGVRRLACPARSKPANARPARPGATSACDKAS